MENKGFYYVRVNSTFPYRIRDDLGEVGETQVQTERDAISIVRLLNVGRAKLVEDAEDDRPDKYLLDSDHMNRLMQIEAEFRGTKRGELALQLIDKQLGLYRQILAYSIVIEGPFESPFK